MHCSALHGGAEEGKPTQGGGPEGRRTTPIHIAGGSDRMRPMQMWRAKRLCRSKAEESRRM